MESRKERSIVFNRTDVDAILDGRKTQFRKIIKPQPNTDNEGNIRWRGWTYVQDTNGGSPHFDSIIDIPGSPFGKIGDILIKYGSLKDNSPRITLEIIDVRVERLHDTTEEDAIKEGIISTYQHDGNTSLKSKKMFKAFPCPFYDILHGIGIDTQKEANKQFRKWGWKVGKQDFCPSCVKKEKEKRNERN